MKKNTVSFWAKTCLALAIFSTNPISSHASITTCAPPPAGLAAWWPGEGNGVDIVGGNTATLESSVGFASGEVGQAFQLNSFGAYLSAPASASLNVGTNDGMTVECWINLTDVSGFHPIVEWRNPNGDLGVHFWLGSQPGDSGLLFANLLDENGNGHGLYSAQNAVVANAPQHVALTYDRTTGVGTLYLDGAVVAQENLGVFVPQTSYQFWMGVRPFDYEGSSTYGSYLGGTLDELSLFKRALTQSEIQSIYNASSTGKCVPPPPTNVPAIFSFSPQLGSTSAVVTITGTNFSTVTAGNIVYFGAVRANVLTASANSLTVSVPPGATYAPITVTVNGLTAGASQSFLPTFAGDGSGISASSFAPRQDIAAGNNAYHVAVADIDGDGKPDLVVGNVFGNSISIYRNISTNGLLTSASFAPRVDLATSSGTYSPYGLIVADVDGDGKLDIVTTDNSQNILSVYQNISTPGDITTNSFASRLDFSTGSQPQGIAVGDLDGDGRLDLLVANSGDGTVSVFRNLGLIGLLTTNSFASKVDVATGSGCSSVAVGDLDGDGKPDMVTANGGSGTVSLLRNISSPGSLTLDSFVPSVDLAILDGPLQVVIGDLDGDGKPDLTVTCYLPQSFSVFRNTSTVGSLTTNSFAPRIDYPLGGWGHTPAIADLDGDGKPDLAVVTELDSRLSIFRNVSTPGSFTSASLAPRVDFGTGWNAWGVAVGDLDGDGRPDVVFCNQYDSTISIYQNIVPITSPTCTAPPAGLVSWWRGESNALDVVGINNGVLMNGAGFGAGEVDTAFNFDGVSQYLLVASPNLNVGVAGGLTIEGWIKPTTVNQPTPIAEYERVLGSYDAADLGVQFYVAEWTTGDLLANVVDAGGGNHQFASAANAVTAGVWQHVALTYDNASGAAKLFVNGVVAAQADLGSFTPHTSFTNLLFGARTYNGSAASPNEMFVGKMDELSLYGRALATSEIQSIYNASTAGKCHSTSAPVTTVQLSNPTVLAGTNVVLSAVVGGTGPFGYQWTFNGTNIAGATNDTLTLTNLHSWQSGNYYVTVTSPYGTNTSSAAVLTVVAENILAYKYSGTAKFTTLGSVVSYGYSGQLFFVPAHTNGTFVGWAVIKGNKQYWTSSLSDYLLITIPGKGSQTLTLMGTAGQAIDESGQPHLWADLHKGQNTLLNIGNQQSYSFPNTLSSASTHAYPNPLTGRMVLSEATSTYTFSAQPTRTANNTGQTVTDLVGDLVKSLEAKGYRKQQ